MMQQDSIGSATYFDRSGVRLHVDDQGGPGLPVIFQHGLCGDASQTCEAFPRLSAFRRVTLECRGHGQSEPGDLAQCSIATFADDIATYVESLRAGPLVVGGISMGAAIALRIAVLRPELVKALILVRPAWITTAAPTNMSPNALVGNLLHQHPADQAHRVFMESDVARLLAESAPDNLKSLESFFQREPQDVTAALLQQISADGPGVDEAQVRNLSIPVLVIGTRDDIIHPLSSAQAISDLIPGSTFRMVTSKAVSKARYLSEIQQGITAFLQEHPAMTNPDLSWIDKLPTDRLIAEFSVWSADLVNLAADMKRIDGYADTLHVDVADGHFAPALLFFPDLVAGLKKASKVPIHVHLMCADSILLSQIEQFAESGASLISIHAENGNAGQALDLLDHLGVSAGMVLKVESPVALVQPFLTRLRFVTLLGTAIGVKGQGLDEKATARLQEAKGYIEAIDSRSRIVLAADGGIREHTVPLLRNAGAETVVLGSLAFGAADLAKRIQWLHAL
jgi:ribulose-phosphate 3-epimerase